MRESRLQLFILVLAALFHPITESWLRPWQLTVDYPFLVIFWIALRRGPLPGTVAGFSIGLIRDLAGASTLGASSLAFVISAYFVGAVREKVDRENLLIRLTLLGFSYLFMRSIALLADSGGYFSAAFLSWVRFSLGESLLICSIYLLVLICVRLLVEGARLLHEPGSQR